MGIEIRKEQIAFTQKKSRTKIDTVVENDIIIPDVKEDIKAVVNNDSYVKITTCELQNDRALLGGTVTHNIMYVTDTENPELRSIQTSFNFTDVSDIKGLGEFSDKFVTANITKSEFNVLNGRKLNVKCTVSSDIKVYEKIEKYVAVEDEKIPGFENVTESVQVCDLNAPFSHDIELEEKVSFPLSDEGAKEILRVYANISDKNVKIINGKVIVKGEVVINSIYEGIVSKEIKTVGNTVGFTEIFDVSGISSDVLSNINFDVSYVNYTPFENADGEIRGADTKIGLCCHISYYQNKKFEIIKDCYSLNQKVNLKTENISVASSITEVNKQITVKDSVEISGDAPKIKQILDVDSKGYITNIREDGDSIAVSGSVDSYLVYMSHDKQSPLYSAFKSTPFEEKFKKPDSDITDSVLSLNTLGASYSFGDENSAEIRCNVELKGIITGVANKSLISDIEFEELDNSKSKAPSFIVYFTKKGDLLWDIAKKYRTTVSGIKEMNGIENDYLKEGVKLFIPRS